MQRYTKSPKREIMSTTKNHPSPSSTVFLLLPLALLTLVYMFYFNNFHVLSFFCTSFVSAFSTANGTSKMPPPADRHTNLKMFFGILTMPHIHERRHLLRSVYALQTHNLTAAKVDVRFIFCNSIGDAEKMHLAMEITLYGDIIILDCVENLNNGKTYTYFSSLPSLLGTGHNRPYDYVVKADDDAYFRLDNLALVLKDKPRNDLYYGMELQCDYVKGSICGVHNTFMAGFGYVLSWDLVEWIAESDIARSNKKGAEDMLLAKWFNTRGRGKNRYNGVPAMYDYNVNMSEKNDYQHDFIPDTVAVHKLKHNFKWIRVLEYFNVTNSLKPSKLYRSFH